MPIHHSEAAWLKASEGSRANSISQFGQLNSGSRITDEQYKHLRVIWHENLKDVLINEDINREAQPTKTLEQWVSKEHVAKASSILRTGTGMEHGWNDYLDSLKTPMKEHAIQSSLRCLGTFTLTCQRQCQVINAQEREGAPKISTPVAHRTRRAIGRNVLAAGSPGSPTPSALPRPSRPSGISQLPATSSLSGAPRPPGTSRNPEASRNPATSRISATSSNSGISRNPGTSRNSGISRTLGTSKNPGTSALPRTPLRQGQPAEAEAASRAPLRAPLAMSAISSPMRNPLVENLGTQLGSLSLSDLDTTPPTTPAFPEPPSATSDMVYEEPSETRQLTEDEQIVSGALALFLNSTILHDAVGLEWIESRKRFICEDAEAATVCFRSDVDGYMRRKGGGDPLAIMEVQGPTPRE